MKRFTIFTLFLVSAGFAWSPSAAAQEIKIGFVNIVRVMEQAPQAEAAREALEQEFSGRDASLTTGRDSIIELERKLRTEAEIMSAEQREDLERDIASRKLDFNRDREELQEDFNIRRNEELSDLQRVVYEVIVEVAKSEDYDLMVTERVLYASERIDITDTILERLQDI
ncbi:MAG: OmpH family outer membrane protein [Gammaproteobacteria bacterium]|nr:OmpH family outer membrane protein [Gammaproteobacteria bacterium]